MDNQNTETIGLLIRILAEDASLLDFEHLSSKIKIDMDTVFNEVAVLIAHQFLKNELDFENADYAINTVWLAMCDYMAKDQKNLLSEPAYSIYCAFDDGEFTHSDGLEPIEAYTKPELIKILGLAPNNLNLSHES